MNQQRSIQRQIDKHGCLNLKRERSLSNERLDTGVTETDNITFVRKMQRTKQGIEVPGRGCGCVIKIDQTLEVYFYKINECSQQLFGE